MLSYLHFHYYWSGLALLQNQLQITPAFGSLYSSFTGSFQTDSRSGIWKLFRWGFLFTGSREVAPSLCRVTQRMTGKTEVFAKWNVCEWVLEITYRLKQIFQGSSLFYQHVVLSFSQAAADIAGLVNHTASEKKVSWEESGCFAI